MRGLTLPSVTIRLLFIFLSKSLASNEWGKRPQRLSKQSTEALNNIIFASSAPRRTFLNPTKQRSSGASDIDSDFDPQFMPKNPSQNQGNGNRFDSSVPQDTSTIEDTGIRLPHSPVIYRYYGKKRSRTRASGSIPFILLGSNVDNWRTVGEHLAARGFSVIACERDPLESDEESGQGTVDNAPWMAGNWWEGEDQEGANLISNVLQASRWSKAILVACDSEAVVAIQAAFRLAPEKIAGLVLCGDLTEVDALLRQTHPNIVHRDKNFAIDAFLNKFLPCQFAIAWDGDSASANTKVSTPSEYDGSSPAECLSGNRCFILGGGIAPHRRQPETFAWTLTRFVEDKVAPSIPIAEKRKLFRRVRKERKAEDEVTHWPTLPKGLKRMLSHSAFSGDFFSSGSFVVYGRILASALLYGSMLKVAIFQYGNFLDGAANLKTRYDVLRSLKGKMTAMMAGFFRNYGYIPLFFRGPATDPFDFVTPLESDEHGEMGSVPEDNGEEKPAQEHALEQEDSKSGPEHAAEESDDDGGEDENDEDDESSTADDPPPEAEKEERHPFQPLFYLDRVVAMDWGSGETVYNT